MDRRRVLEASNYVFFLIYYRSRWVLRHFLDTSRYEIRLNRKLAHVFKFYSSCYYFKSNFFLVILFKSLDYSNNAILSKPDRHNAPSNSKLEVGNRNYDYDHLKLTYALMCSGPLKLLNFVLLLFVPTMFIHLILK